MVYRVVSTKLTEEEHSRLLDLCNNEGCTPSAILKKLISKEIQPTEPVKEESIDKITVDDLKRALLARKSL